MTEDRDQQWAAFNRAVQAAMTYQDLRRLKNLYFEMAHFLWDKGRDHLEIHQQSAKMQLLDHKRSGVVSVSISTEGDASCPACQQLKGKTFLIDEALEQMPIPVENCTFELEEGKPGWCRCRYIAVFD